MCVRLRRRTMQPAARKNVFYLTGEIVSALSYDTALCIFSIVSIVDR